MCFTKTETASRSLIHISSYNIRFFLFVVSAQFCDAREPVVRPDAPLQADPDSVYELELLTAAVHWACQ